VKLDKLFYQRETKTVAQTLLGCTLVSEIGGKSKRTSGVIVETEAYLGETDPGSHAYKGKTKRTQIMYGEAGRAYVYLIYGKYYLLNVVTEPVGTAGAVLIRALEPVCGVDVMAKRRNTDNLMNLTTGPGRLTQALGITKTHNGLDITGALLWVESNIVQPCIQSSPRIGVSDRKTLRFFVKENRFVSESVR
jgi:DNA-3-methyladenine glycosylase